MTYEIVITGAVQGVGYRPFVARLAEEMNLTGEVRNEGGFVRILVSDGPQDEDESPALAFAQRLQEEAPEGAMVLKVDVTWTQDRSFDRFTIVESAEADPGDLAVFPPDIGVCSVCGAQMADPKDRRFRYPLISCASCGPRWSILRRLPYDRDTTTMDRFEMCEDCRTEYTGRLDPLDRRRHAQTISCHDCGPQMILRLPGAEKELRGEEGFAQAVRILDEGGILMLKGVGGYQLLASPFREETAARLRRLKGRDKKPFAILFPDVDAVRRSCRVSAKEEEILKSSARPIVLLEKDGAAASYDGRAFADNVCGISRYLGAFLPAAGIHTLLTQACGPLIATSANISDQPIPIRDEDAFRFVSPDGTDRPDAVYYHARQILRPLDDSVAAVQGSRVSLIRRSRGYVPLPVFTEQPGTDLCVLAAGADLKSSFCVQKRDRVILSQYLGDLEHYEVQRNYRAALADLLQVFHAVPQAVVCDLHPGYFSGKLAQEYADQNGLPLVKVQHHIAHVASVMAEHRLNGCIGIALDGTGYGTDGTLWGGEIFFDDGKEFARMGFLEPVLLLGADEAARNAQLTYQCCRSAAGLPVTDPLIEAALKNRVNTIPSSSAGRLFDAVSALLGISSYNTYEAECAIALENAAAAAQRDPEACRAAEDAVRSYFAGIVEVRDRYFVISQTGMIRALLAMLADGAAKETAALSFHLALAGALYDVVRMIHTLTGEKRVCLSGGVFANRILCEHTEKLLRIHGFAVYWNECVPGNDGGICLGQALMAHRMLRGAQNEE